MLALCLSVEIANRNNTEVEEIIGAIASCYSEQDAAKKIFAPVLGQFDIDDRIWFDEMRQNARWN